MLEYEAKQLEFRSELVNGQSTVEYSDQTEPLRER